jgi:hypothetical protein
VAQMRISSSKFWGWVVVSLLVGLGIGLGIMMLNAGSQSSRITVLENQVASAGADASAAVAAAQAQLASTDASLVALSEQNAQLTADLTAAQAEIAAAADKPSETTTPTIAVTSRTISPSTADASATITLTAKVTGAPDHVTMRIYNSSKSYDKTFSLHKASTSGDTETWHASAKAPGLAGTYKYYATATTGSVHVTKVGASPSTLTIQ